MNPNLNLNLNPNPIIYQEDFDISLTCLIKTASERIENIISNLNDESPTHIDTKFVGKILIWTLSHEYNQQLYDICHLFNCIMTIKRFRNS